MSDDERFHAESLTVEGLACFSSEKLFPEGRV